MSFGDSWKALGNQAYQNGDFAVAIENFSRAIEADSSNPVYWSNRSLAYASLQDWKLSLADANQCIALDPKNVKGNFRRVNALLKLDHLVDARRALLTAIKQCGECKDLRALEELVFERSGTPVRPKSSDFEIVCELGDGNFSKVYKTYLKKNKQIFAIKTIEKQTVDRMKRRHPNINNEILMEKRALHKLHHPGIITLLATFQDFGTLYYQMEYIDGPDLWTALHELLPLSSGTSSVIEPDADHVPIFDANGYDQNTPKVRRATGAQVGIHWSFLRLYFAEMLSALEHMHTRGIVHRDIKPENIILTPTGHLKFIDFGTAKDMIERDLNGQEFVGTPEYMSPNTLSVKGGGSNARTSVDAADQFSGEGNDVQGKEETRLDGGVGIEADIWAIGVVLHQLVLGFTPFKAASPYLTFLRIKRDLLLLPSWLPDNIAQLIRDLLQKDGKQRMLSAIGVVINGYESDPAVYRSISYDPLRNHDFFMKWDQCVQSPNRAFYGGSQPCVTSDDSDFASIERVKNVYAESELHSTIPSLHDLCVRAVADATVKIAFATANNGGIKPKITWMQRFQLSKRLSQVDRQRVMHHLDRQERLHVLGVHRMFFSSLPESRCQRTSWETKEVVGLSHSLQGHHTVDFQFVVLTSPFIGLSNELNEEEESAQEWKLKGTVSAVNKIRPKFLSVVGPFTAAHCEGDEKVFLSFADRFRKLIARVSETIPALFVCSDREVGTCPTPSSLERYRSLFGADYYGFWLQGMRAVVINSSLLLCGHGAAQEASLQLQWLEEQIEQAKLCSSTMVLMSYHPFFYEHVDEEDLEEDCGKIRNIPKAVRLSILQKLRHHKVKLLLTSAHGDPNMQPLHPFGNQSVVEAVDVDNESKEVNDEKEGQANDDSDSDSDGFDNVESECSGPQLLFALPEDKTASSLSLRLVHVREDGIDHRACVGDDIPTSMQQAMDAFKH